MFWASRAERPDDYFNFGDTAIVDGQRSLKQSNKRWTAGLNVVQPYRHETLED